MTSIAYKNGGKLKIGDLVFKGSQKGVRHYGIIVGFWKSKNRKIYRPKIYWVKRQKAVRHLGIALYLVARSE